MRRILQQYSGVALASPQASTYHPRKRQPFASCNFDGVFPPSFEILRCSFRFVKRTRDALTSTVGTASAYVGVGLKGGL